MDSGAVTSRQLVEIYLARIAAYDKQGPALNAIVAINPDAVDDRRRARRRAQDARLTRAAARHSGAGQGQLRDRRDADRGRLDRAGVLPPAIRRVPGEEAARRGRRDSWQDEHARTRRRHLHRRLAIWPDAESVRPRSQSRWIERWNGSGGGREFRAWRAWAATRAGRSAIRQRTTTSSACAARTVCRAAWGSCRCRARRTSAGRSRGA